MARPIGIRIHRGSELLEAQVFERDIIKIGRLASAHLRLEDPKVSRIHAVIEISEAREVSIIDMGSAEGTRVNGEKVSRARLKHGDEIGLGDSRLVVVLDDAELAAMKGGALAAAPAMAAATPEVGPSPTGSVTNGAGIFQSGETDVAALRAELQASAPSSPMATDVFNAPAIDVALESLAPQAPVESAPPMPAPPEIGRAHV